MESSEFPDFVEAPDVYAFANTAYVRKPGEVVYIDFVQIDAAFPIPPGRGSAVARVVIHPALAAELAEELSQKLANGTD